LLEKCAKVANNPSYIFLQTLLHYIIRSFTLGQWKRIIIWYKAFFLLDRILSELFGTNFNPVSLRYWS